VPPTDRNEVLDRVRTVCSEISGPRAAEVDSDARWPAESLRALQKAGIGGLTVPEASGGLGQGLLSLVQVCELLGRECPSTALCLGMHGVGAAVIAAKASPHQQERYLEPIARGDHLTTLALSESGTGIHLYFPQAELASEAGGDFRVTGTKTLVTNGGYAVRTSSRPSPQSPWRRPITSPAWSFRRMRKAWTGAPRGAGWGCGAIPPVR